MKLPKDIVRRAHVKWRNFDKANCIGFALGLNGVVTFRRLSKTQRKMGITKRTMPTVLSDYGLTPLTETDVKKIEIPKGHHLIAVFIDKIKFDYHAYRLGHDKRWYHKRVGLPVSHFDASLKTIWDPRKADRDYRSKEGPWRVVGHNYTEFCCFALVDEKASFEIAARLVAHWKKKQLRARKKAVKSIVKKVPLVAAIHDRLPETIKQRLN